jgi:hypothetical protein
MIHVNGNNNIFEGFEFSGANAAIEDGIKLDFPNGSSAGGQVLGNLFTLFGLVHGCSGGGPILSGQQNAIIDSNVLYANGGTPGTSGTGCQQEDGIYINNGNGTTVTNNIVINHGGGCVGPLSQCNVGSPLQINDEFSGDQRNFPSNVNMSNNTVVNSGNMVYWECYLSGFVCSNVWTNNNLLVNINNFHNLTGTAITLGTIGSGTFGSGIQFVSDLWYQGATGFCAQGQQPGGLACPGSVSGAVTSNPLFVNNRGDLTGDYHLQAGSPAIAAGTSSGCPSHDFEGNPRTGVCTIGAYAYGGSGSAPPPNPPMGLTATVN